MSSESNLSRADFGPDFWWGSATASYQIEGAVQEDGRGQSIWDTFSHTPGKTFGGANGDIACDHYHRYRQDVELMSQMGLNAYRFSIAWPRILPTGSGSVNQKGLDFYERLVESLLEKNIQPFATLYHWDLPQALEDRGGWRNRATAEYFAEYADIVSRRLGDRIKGWITLNEPWVSAALGHITGEHAPGLHNMAAGIQAGHHLLLGHGLALPVLRRNATRPDAEFGITLSLNYFDPGDDSQQAQEATNLAETFANRWFLDPLFKGTYPELLNPVFGSILPIQPGDMDLISGSVDFLGVNYYFRQSPVAIQDQATLNVKTAPHPESKHTLMGWEVYPEGLYKLLLQLQRDYSPAKMYITENGASYEDKLVEEQGIPVVHDPDRLEYMHDHFAAALQAKREGANLRGYFPWSLMDNFEWSFGYERRFGLTYVDYPTQRRVLKDSGRWYQQFLKGK